MLKRKNLLIFNFTDKARKPKYCTRNVEEVGGGARVYMVSKIVSLSKVDVDTNPFSNRGFDLSIISNTNHVEQIWTFRSNRILGIRFLGGISLFTVNQP